VKNPADLGPRYLGLGCAEGWRALVGGSQVKGGVWQHVGRVPFSPGKHTAAERKNDRGG